MNDFHTKLSYIKTINEFKHLNNLFNGKEFLAKIDVENEKGQCLFADTCRCLFFYDFKFREYRVEIFWRYTDIELKKMGLKKAYSTNFQKFSLADRKLEIESDNNYIFLEGVDYKDD